jgi:hypothetical protein
MTKALEIKKDNSVKEFNMQDALMQIVQRSDIDPERLEKFLDLQIKMENRQAEQAFHAAMSAFQGECPIIKRTKKTDFESKSGGKVKYDYSPLDEIVFIIKPILAKHGLSFSFDLKEGDKTSTLFIDISHKDGFCKRFTYPFDTIHDDGRMNLSQRRKSALTYAKRGGLESALGIVTSGEDDDARRAIDNMITGAQLNQIKELLASTKTDEKAFKDFVMVKDFAELSEYDAKRAISALKAKRSKNINKG